MNISSSNSSKTVSKDGKSSFTLRESYEDETSKTLRVEEAENGFIVYIERSYYEGEGEKKSYKYEEKKYISFTNPLEEKIKEKKKEEKKTETKDVISSINSFLAGMTNKMIIT